MIRAFKLLLVLMLLVFPAILPAQQATPAPPVSPGTNPEFLRTADEILAEMSQILELPARAPLAKSIRSREQIREYLVAQLKSQKDVEKRLADQKVLEKFGLLPRGFELEKFLIALLSEQIAGLYDPKAGEFFIADWLDLAEQKFVMAHELVHALHDQHFQIESWLDAAKPNDDAQLARDAVLEGAALGAMFDYILRDQKRGIRDLPEMEKVIRLQMAGEFQSNPLFASAPMYIREALLFPYLAGTTFTQRILKSGKGWADFNKVFAQPPGSTQHILHPDLYLAGISAKEVKLPALKPLLPKEWKELDQNVMGEFGFSLVLRQFLGEERAAQLAPAWSGDRYAILEHARTKRPLLIFRLRLASAEDAARFHGQYSELLEKKYSERRELLRRPNFFSFTGEDGGVFLQCAAEECLVVEGASRQAFEKVARAAGMPAAPRVPRPGGAAQPKNAARHGELPAPAVPGRAAAYPAL